MKNLVLFFKHTANVTFRVLMALFILAAVSTVYPETVQYTPHVIALSVGVYLVAQASKKREGVLNVATQADPFNVSQLQIKDIVLTAIRQHFGGREVPKILDKQIVRRRDIYQIQHLTVGESVFKFFTKLSASPFFSNLKEVSLASNKMYIFFGIVAETATGASAADAASALAFAASADEEILNGEIMYKVNTKTRIEGQPYKTAFINDDAVKNYLRFPQPIVWEPAGENELELRLAAAFGAGVFKYQKFTLVGYELAPE